MIADVVISDKADRKVGDAKTITVTDYFVGDSDLTFMATVGQMNADLIKSVKQDMPGKFTIDIADLAGVDDGLSTNTPPDQVELDYPGNVMVTVTATDEAGLWTTQEFAVRRNRAPRNRTTATTELETDVAAIHLGITSMTTKRLKASDDLFIDDTDDELTLTPRVTDPAAVEAMVDRGEFVTLKALKVTPAITVRFSVMDSDGLSAPDEAEIMVTVHDGPRKVEGELDVRRPLGDETAVIPLASFIKAFAAGGATTYEASSKNELIANAQVGTLAEDTKVVTPVPAGPNLVLVMKSLGTTEITIKATQAAATPAPAQELEVKFNLTVE